MQYNASLLAAKAENWLIDQHAIARGAIWKESDSIYSNYHPVFGSVTGWV